MTQKDDRDLDAPTPPGGPMRRDEPGVPPGEHDSELPDGTTQDDADRAEQEENAGTTMDQPSQ